MRHSFRSSHSVLTTTQLVCAVLFCNALSCYTVAAQEPRLSLPVSVAKVSTIQNLAKAWPVLSNGQYAIKGGESDSYLINLRVGQFLYALVEQQGIDVTIALYKPDGSQIAVCDSPNDRWGTEPVLLVADVSGEYRVEVRAPDVKADSAHYEIKIEALREATSTDKTHVGAQRAFEDGQKLRSQPNATAKRAAILKFQEAQPLFQAVGDTYRQALTAEIIGIAHAQLNEFRMALPFFDEALSLARNVRDQRMEASVETLIGGANDVLGEVRRSQEHYERALIIARRFDNRSIEGSVFNNIGKLYNDAGDFQKALEYYLKALPLFKDLPGRLAITLNNIGVAYKALGEPEKALGYLQLSLPLFQAEGGKSGESYTLSNIGAAYSRFGKYDEALNYYGQAQAIQEKTGNRAQQAETLDLAGVNYSAMGQPETALQYHQQALEIQRATKNVRREALCLSNLGHVYGLLGQPEKALEHFDKALAIFR